MQGNRATQKFGLVNAVCFFYLLGEDWGWWGVTFSSTVYTHVPFRFTPSPNPSAPLPCVFAHLPDLCVLCVTL